MKEELNKYYNVNVLLTHNGAGLVEDTGEDLAARAMVARNNNAELYVSIHINDESSHTATGANVFATSRTELYKYKEGMTLLGNKILNNLNKLGIKNNGVINDKLCNDHEPRFQYYDGSQADYYADIRHAMKGDTYDLGPNFSDGSGVPTVLIEHCFMNSSDSQFIDSEEDLKNLAKADGDAIADYLGLRLNGTVATRINVDKENINLLVGEKEKVNVTIEPQNVENKSAKWVSDDSNIAKVDGNGNITAVSEGKTKIIVTSKDNPNVSKTININVEEPKANIIELSNGEKIMVNKYDIKDNKISNIHEKVTIQEFLKNFEMSDNLEIIVKKANEEQQYIGTNSKVQIKDKENGIILNEYDCIVYGDIDENGIIEAKDAVLILKHVAHNITLENIQFCAADTDKNGKVDAKDAVMVLKHVANNIRL